MTIEVNKQGNEWLVQGQAFSDHDEAVHYAIEQGADTINVRYSNGVVRSFDKAFFA